jgi:hypothetical protein
MPEIENADALFVRNNDTESVNARSFLKISVDPPVRGAC